MRINEITKSAVNEGVLDNIKAGLKTASGAVSNVASGVADVAGRSIMQNYGGSAGGAYNSPVAPGARQGAASAMNQALIKPLANSMMKTWTTGTLPHLMATSGATEAGQIKQQALTDVLEKQIKTMLKADYNSVKVDPAALGGEAVELAQQAKDAITQAVQRITPYPRPGSGQSKNEQTVTAEFTELAKAIAAMQNIMVFHGDSASGAVKVTIDPNTGKYAFDGQPYDPSNQAHVAAYSKIQAANAAKTQ